MEFTCTQENIVHGLSQVVPVTGRNRQLPILANILLEVREGVLHLTGTDLEIGIHAIVGGKAGKRGSCALPARQLLEYIQQLPNNHPIELQSNGKNVHVTTPGFQASFRTIESEDFPLLPALLEEGGVRLSAAALCQGISEVVFAAAREEARPEIHSVYVVGESGELRLAATDSFRLAESVLPFPSQGQTERFTLLLPLSCAQEVVRLFSNQESVELLVRDALIVLRGEGVELSSRLVDAQYPDYRQIIPQGSTARLTVSREDFMRALKTLLVFLPRDSRRLRLTYQANKQALQLRVEGGETGEGEVNVVVEGEGGKEELWLNIQYILEGVSHIQGEKCEVLFKGPEAPVVFRPVRAGGYLYVVMPIQA